MYTKVQLKGSTDTIDCAKNLISRISKLKGIRLKVFTSSSNKVMFSLSVWSLSSATNSALSQCTCNRLGFEVCRII